MLTPNSNISSIKRKIPPTSRHDLGRRESLGTATIARNERFRMSRYQKWSISWSNSHWASRTSPLKILRLSPKWRFWNTFLLQKCHDLIRNSELMTDFWWNFGFVLGQKMSVITFSVLYLCIKLFVGDWCHVTMHKTVRNVSNVLGGAVKSCHMVCSEFTLEYLVSTNKPVHVSYHHKRKAHAASTRMHTYQPPTDMGSWTFIQPHR